MAGAEVAVLPLTTRHRSSVFEVAQRTPGHAVLVARGRAMPEALSWSLASTLKALRYWSPDVVVCNTGRAFHPGLLDGPWRVILDFVDRLSVSYRDRADIVGRRSARVGYHLLARAAGRFEAESSPAGVHRIAAGWADAQALGAEWVPVLPCAASRAEGLRTPSPDHDLVFVGTLCYPPNIAGVRQLARVWPDITAHRPGTSCLVAGREPTAEIHAMADAHGWTVVADFVEPSSVWSRARLAVVPLQHASGIQIKVLDAALHGLAQVIQRPATLGLAPGFPAEVVDDDAAFVDAIVRLLDDDVRRQALAAAAQAHVADMYSVERWAKWASELLASVSQR
jgi:glycosyltransferase involved in cell wall biosynthesis